MKINVSEAMVKTAAVEIKTLTISGKQVTLAVFRQLQEEALIDPKTCKLNGVPWGRVNYHPDQSCKDTGEHIHVVWQKGSELRRSCVREISPVVEAFEPYEDGLIHWRNRMMLARPIVLWLASGMLYNDKPTVDLVSGLISQEQYINNRRRIWLRTTFIGTHSDAYANSIHIALKSIRGTGVKKHSGDFLHINDYIRALGHLLPGCIVQGNEWDVLGSIDRDMEMIKKSLGLIDKKNEDARQAANSLRKDWGRHYTALLGLDQLFIAV